MRFVLLSTLIASLFLPAWTATGTNDENTANWVLDVVADLAVTPNKTKVDLTPTGALSTTDCTTDDNESGICVLYYQCNSKTKIVIEDGEGLLDLRTNTCPHYLEVCCKTNDVQNKQSEDGTQTTYEETKPAITSTTSKPVVVVKDEPIKPRISQCGWSNPGAISHFVFRDTNSRKTYEFALYGEFPWMVALLQKTSNSDVWSQADYLGGGTLIHPSVVMTLAHKLKKRKKSFTPNELKCRAGEWDTQTELELYKHQERDVAKFITHEDYYRISLYNDIALLVLERPFQLANAPHMGVACLAPSPPRPGRVCYSMGWGSVDREDKKKYAHILKKVLLHTVERDTCQQMLRTNSRLRPLFELHESLTCANGDENVDTCRGDGGSPLVCAISDDPGEMRFAVYGMVAYGTKCFDPSVPGLYADTAHLKGWIDAKMQQEGFDTEYYTI